MAKQAAMSDKPKSVRRKSPRNQAYAEGRQAFKRGYPNTVNPYPCLSGANDERIDWFNGWYFEKYEQMFSEMDQRRAEQQ